MPSNTLGNQFTVSSFGESHGKCIGAIVDGCPAGLHLSEADIQPLLDLRKPGQSIITTQRKETDTVEILSGVFNGFTTGAPICMIIWNKDSDSRSYDEFMSKPRPGHADYTAYLKYGGFNDYRGSGRFSGRLTATLGIKLDLEQQSNNTMAAMLSTTGGALGTTHGSCLPVTIN